MNELPSQQLKMILGSAVAIQVIVQCLVASGAQESVKMISETEWPEPEFKTRTEARKWLIEVFRKGINMLDTAERLGRTTNENDKRQ